MTIEQAAAHLRARKISALELTRESLKRIREQQPRLNAFITVTEDLAIERARRADEELARGFDRGPLHGIPYALKDVFDIRGVRTTCGSKIFADRIAENDCAVFEKLTEAGAVPMGKTGLHELAYGITNDNPHFGPVRNPHDVQRIAGGSSGGSGAAVAAELVYFALGTDTGGSTRIPAAYCGCVGLKPTMGRISRYGMMPLGHTLDHAGIFTRSPRDAALVLNAIAGFDRRDDSSSRQPVPDYLPDVNYSVSGLRIGVPERFFHENLAPSVAHAYAEALRHAENRGARLVPLQVPPPDEINVIGRLILLAEASALMQPYLERSVDLGTDVLELLYQGVLIRATDYIDAQRLRRSYQRRWALLWKHADVIVTPTIAIEAPLIGQEKVLVGETEQDVRLASTRLVRPFNVLGLPAVSIPGAPGILPTGLQVISKPFDEVKNLAAATGLSETSPL
jgi:aspartyl-tRNA(Asn)/glutamyl-tRNA(Gln) amidotransferase subunit A